MRVADKLDQVSLSYGHQLWIVQPLDKFAHAHGIAHCVRSNCRLDAGCGRA